MDFTGDMVGFVPDSPGFRLGLEAYLARKRVHEGAVNAAWGMLENIQSIEVAARLIPMWCEKRGLSYAYDRATAHFYPIDATETQLWQDVNDFRDSSALEYMNTISDVLKKHVRNVPVIFKDRNTTGSTLTRSGWPASTEWGSMRQAQAILRSRRSPAPLIRLPRNAARPPGSS